MPEPFDPSEVWVKPADINLRPSRAILAGEWTLARLADLGVRVPSQNRLTAAVELLRRFNVPGAQLDPTDTSFLSRLADAQRTIAEQALIARHLPPLPDRTSAYLEKLGEMLAGAELEREDANPKGRNTQFELYLATVMRIGGIKTIIEEPDLIIDYNGQRVGIAAKRLTSASQLSKRCREASEQIRRTERRGFVALSVDVLVRSMPPASADDEQRALYRELLAPLERIEQDLAANEHILGTFLFASTLHWTFEGVRPKFRIEELRRLWPFPRSKADLVAFTGVCARLVRGLETTERHIYGG